MSQQNTAGVQPIFAQPQPSPDPTGFKDPVTDQKERELKDLGAVPQPRGGAAEPILTLEEVYGSAGTAKVQAIQSAGQIAIIRHRFSQFPVIMTASCTLMILSPHWTRFCGTSALRLRLSRAIPEDCYAPR